jgi:hypothetical protein
MVAACPLRGRARREKLRLQAAQMFEQDVDPVQVAQLLRVSTKSAYQWRRRPPCRDVHRGRSSNADRTSDHECQSCT